VISAMDPQGVEVHGQAAHARREGS
jgi:hypothetical protein